MTLHWWSDSTIADCHQVCGTSANHIWIKHYGNNLPTFSSITFISMTKWSSDNQILSLNWEGDAKTLTSTISWLHWTLWRYMGSHQLIQSYWILSVYCCLLDKFVKFDLFEFLKRSGRLHLNHYIKFQKFIQ